MSTSPILQASTASPTGSGDILELLQLKSQLLAASPFVEFEFVDVTFSATPDLDHDIKHAMRPNNPESVLYEIVKKDRAVNVYNDQSGTRRPWGTGYIVVRSNVANAVVTLLLFVPRTS